MRQNSLAWKSFPLSFNFVIRYFEHSSNANFFVSVTWKLKHKRYFAQCGLMNDTRRHVFCADNLFQSLPLPSTKERFRIWNKCGARWDKLIQLCEYSAVFECRALWNWRCSTLIMLVRACVDSLHLQPKLIARDKPLYAFSICIFRMCDSSSYSSHLVTVKHQSWRSYR